MKSDFSPRIDACIRFYAIWITGTFLGWSFLLGIAPLNKYVILLITAIPSISLAWVYTKLIHSMDIESKPAWVQWLLSAKFMGSTSSILIAVTILAPYLLQ